MRGASMFGEINNYRSGLLTVVIEVDQQEDFCSVLSVKGNKKVPRPGSLSDVEWFRESWSNADYDLIWGDELPESGRYCVTGRFSSWRDNTPDSQDWNEEFEVKSIERYIPWWKIWDRRTKS